MTLPKQKFRELSLQLLYCHFANNAYDDEIDSFFMMQLKVTKKSVGEAIKYKNQIVEKLDYIDKIIEKTSISYDFKRISLVELNILRLGIFEMLFNDDIPAKVAIAEAIRLCRKFATPESANFVNAIMDHNKPSVIKENV